MKRRPIVLFAMLLPILASVVTTVYMEPSYAQDQRQRQGIYFEQQASAGGVDVRRMRDNSTSVVCYVARSPEAYGNVTKAFSVAISCVKANP